MIASRHSAGLIGLLLGGIFSWSCLAGSSPQSSSITYQGRLTFTGQPATTTYDFECRLFDAASGGNQVGPLLTPGSIEADDQGVFTMTLDFGALAFDGNERWLQLGVRESGGGPAFTPLTPRQKIEAAPYAAYALRSALSGTYGEAVTLSNPANAITGAFSGSGAGLSNLNAGAISGIINSANISGSYSNAVTLNNAANVFTGSGAGLTALNASNLSSGTVGIARLPSGGNWSLATNLTFDTDLFFINPTNNLVGIGTTSPGAPLDVQRTSSTNIINPLATFRSAGTGTSSGSLRTQNSAGNHFNFGITAAGDFGLGYNANIGLANDLIRVSPNGDTSFFDSSGGLAAMIDVDGLASAGEFRLYAPDGITPTIRMNGQQSFAGGRIGLGTATGGERVSIEGNYAGSSAGGIVVDDTSGLSSIRLLGDSGTVFANTFRLNTNFQGAVSIRGNCFVPTSDNIDYVCAPHLVALSGTQVSFNAAVHVPDGSNIVGIELVALDNSAAEDISLTIERLDDTGVTTSWSSTFVSSSGSSALVRTFTAAPFASVDNDAFAYSVRVVWDVPSPTNSIVLHKVKVLYSQQFVP